MYPLILRALGMFIETGLFTASGANSSPTIMHIRYLLKPLDHLMDAAATVPLRHIPVANLLDLIFIHGHVHAVHVVRHASLESKRHTYFD